MKKKYYVLFMLFFCFSSLFASKGTKMYVSVDKTELKNSPSFLGKNLEAIFYGDEVIVLEEKGKWKKVQLSSDSWIEGWINESSLTKKKIVVSDSRLSVSTEELALAGKGFNADIEAQYKKEGNLNYQDVDVVEKNMISFENVLDFMIDGKLENQVVDGE